MFSEPARPLMAARRLSQETSSPTLATLASHQAHLDALSRDLSMRETCLRQRCSSLQSDGSDHSYYAKEALLAELESVHDQMGHVECEKHKIMVCIGGLCCRRS